MPDMLRIRVHRLSMWLFTAVMLLLALLCTKETFAGNPAGDLRIDVLTAYNLIVDSNVETPATYGPKAATFGAKFCNDGSNDLSDVFAYIGNYDASPANWTPGVYPSRTNPPTGQLGTFSFTHEGGTAGTADATRYIGAIPGGECVTQYWLVSYPLLDDSGTTVTRGVKPDDDLWLEYDIWATAKDGLSSVTADVTRRATMRNEISAMANKIWPNNTAQVPDQYLQAIGAALGWDTLGPGGGNNTYPGDTLVTQGIWYVLGNVVHGFDNNGDMVPDQNAWLQPVGDPSSFDPGCFRLVRTYGIIIVKLKEGGELLIPFEDQLYFENIPDNTGVVGLVYYEFVAFDGACSASLTPYQEVASGFDNEKFNADFGYNIPPLQTLPPQIPLDKAVDQTVIGPGLDVSLTYTLTFSNTGTAAAGNPAVGVPLVVQDSVPAGTIYVPGSAAANNTLPAGVGGFTILISCDNGATWQPGECAGVTDIQWWLSDPLNPAAAGSVTFQVTVPGGYPDTFVPNTGTLSFGNAVPFAEDSTLTLIRGSNSLGDLVFADTGAGGGTLGNGLPDGSEPGIQGVTVTLYYDLNGDGLLDEGDILWGTSTTNASGIYGFGSLPDGKYLVIVDPADPSIVTGYTNTTPTTIAVDLDSIGAIGTPVSDLTADFGFAPALTLDKSVTGNGTVYEGQTVQYTLSLSNELPGSGIPGNDSCIYTVWATTEASQSAGLTPNKRFSNSTSGFMPPTNAFGAGGPDGVYANADYRTGANQLLAGTGYGLGTYPGTITSVEALFRIYLSQALVDDYGVAKLYFNNDTTELGSVTYSTATLNARVGVAGMLTWNVTGLRTWTWADFAGNLDLQYGNEKSSGADTGRIFVDALGFRITSSESCPATDDTTLDPVPLNDTFDNTRLTFVSAEPPANSVVGNTITWSNLGPLVPGQTKNIVVTFKALAPSPSPQTITNTATVVGAKYANGRPANNPSDNAPATLLATGSIAGVLWSERTGGTAGWVNPNGYEVADYRIAGAQVTLYGCISTTTGQLIYPGDTTKSCTAPQNGGAWQEIATQNTSASGAYLFEGLLNGYYYVAVNGATIPGTETQTGDPNVRPGQCAGAACDNRSADPTAALSTFTYGTISAANDITNVNFGYIVPAALYGTVWEDNDGDGVRDNGEDGIANVTVQLFEATCTTRIASTTTSATGAYTFGDLISGTTYCVKTLTSSLPDAAGSTWTETAESDSTINNQIAALVQAGNPSGSHDFGFHHTDSSIIGDTLFWDWNGNGTQDAADEGIPNITVFLYEDKNGNGVVDAGTDALVATTSTNAAGWYEFTGLPAGSYTVVVNRNDTDWPSSFSYSQSADPDTAGTCIVCDSRGLAAVDGSNSDLTLDFGYRPAGTGSIGDTVWYDRNGDGVQAGVQETGLPNITVTLWADPNGDDNFTQVLTATTDANGHYLFDNLPFMNYRVIVDSGDSDLPSDAFGNAYVPTTATTVSTTLSGDFLDADFGFTALGAVGDTIFWDTNGNGTQDPGESGINGIEVLLYNDVNGDGTYTPLTDTLAITTTTATAGAEAGKYLFTGLPAGNYVVVVGTIPNSPVLTADPDADGVPCSDPSVSAVCDSQVGVSVGPGTSFMGADFGYRPLGVIGDTLWIDTDGNNQRDVGENGIPYITVTLWLGGFQVGTTTTDADGAYGFANLPDGTYEVRVDTTDTDWPSGVSQTYDPDGVLSNTAVNIIMSGRFVTQIGTNACPVGDNCDLDVDFGYRYVGTYSLSGTVCLESAADGACDTDDSGVGAGEVAYPNHTVYLSRWNGTTWVGITSTQTDANGDYSFTGLPAGDYRVALAAPGSQLDLTTSGPGVTEFTNASGYTTSAYQTVTVSSSVTNVDFAFITLVSYDFGDLPDIYNLLPTSYGITLAGNGPRHAVPATPTLYLGANAPDTEIDGTPSATATGDGSDEDGIGIGPGPGGRPGWDNGSGGGSLNIAVNGSGWLVVWIDFNHDGDFTDAGEMVISRAVSTGTGNYVFAVPANTFCPNGNPSCGTAANDGVINIRARLFPSKPAVPALAYTGVSSSGEVEDHQFLFAPTAIHLSQSGDVPAASAGGIWFALTLALAGLTIRSWRRRIA